MPFVTEELWQMLGQRLGKGAFAPSLLEAPYPARRPVDEAAERSFGPVLGVVEAIRNVRGEMNVPWKTVLSGVEVGALSAEALETLRAELGRVQRLGNVQGLVLHPAGKPAGRRPQCAVSVGDGFEVLVPLAGAVDMAAETARVDKELARLAGEMEGVEKRLQNPSFVERAPREVVEEARARIEELGERRRKLLAHRALLDGAVPPAPPPEAAPAVATSPAAAGERKAAPSGTELARKAAAARKAAPPPKRATPAPKKAASAKKGVAPRKAVPARKPAPARTPARPVKAATRKAPARGKARSAAKGSTRKKGGARRPARR
jgi:valyl-tRNA synthetase